MEVTVQGQLVTAIEAMLHKPLKLRAAFDVIAPMEVRHHQPSYGNLPRGVYLRDEVLIVRQGLGGDRGETWLEVSAVRDGVSP